MKTNPLSSKIRLVDQHHEVLLPWARLRRRLPQAPAVISLDHHTDVLPAFQQAAAGREADRQRLLARVDPASNASIADAIRQLRHDEHFDLALRAGLISRVTIVSHENFTAPAHPGMEIHCDPLFPEPPILLNEPERVRSLADRVLETEFLHRNLPEGLPQSPFILDLDLDYFLTARSLRPADPAFFRQLAEQSELITISRETDWVRLLQLPGENLHTGANLEQLLQLLSG